MGCDDILEVLVLVLRKFQHSKECVRNAVDLICYLVLRKLGLVHKIFGLEGFAVHSF